MRYKPDGSPISSSVPMGQHNPNEHRSLFGIYRGVIIRPVYPDDPTSLSKERIEYVVKVKGQLYPNAIEMKTGGAKFNHSERIRKATEISDSGQVEDRTYDELLDGEHVYVAFLEGWGNVPLIIGAAEHPTRGKYKKFKKADGVFDISEFNGVQIGIDKDSNYLIKQVGRKDTTGKILNEAAKDAFIKMFGNGDLEFNTHGTDTTADLRMKFNKEAKKFELYAQENKAVFDELGIKFTDKFGNIVEMKSGEIKITVVGNLKLAIDGNIDMTATGDAKITATGNAIVKATGDATLQADGKAIVKGTAGTDIGTGSSITKVDGTQVLLAGGGPPVARLGDMCVGIGNKGAPVVSNILQGSTKVLAG